MSATLYGVYSRGLLTGSKSTGASDFRQHLPRFTGEAGKKNAALVDSIAAFAKERGMKPAQVLLNWVLAKQPRLVPIVGAKTPAQINDAIDALDKPLSAEDVAAFEKLIPAGTVVGDRYHPDHMKSLDSER